MQHIEILESNDELKLQREANEAVKRQWEQHGRRVRQIEMQTVRDHTYQVTRYVIAILFGGLLLSLILW